MSNGDGEGVVNPWAAVKVEFARKAARRVLRGRSFLGSDAVDELAAAALVEVCEGVARGVSPSQRVYRLAALHQARELWRRHGRERKSVALEDKHMDGSPDVERGEMRAISLHDLTCFYRQLDERSRDVLAAYLACDTTTEIADRRGETFAAIDSLLSRLLRHLRDGTMPSTRGPRDKAGLTCLGCGVELPVPPGRGGLPLRCKPCSAARRKAMDSARHASR